MPGKLQLHKNGFAQLELVTHYGVLTLKVLVTSW